ncbi:MAG: metal-dependent hydrolase [Desulfovibrio sp.]|nr:metal-dependent hydrolase [Desulfovibrio sp.]
MDPVTHAASGAIAMLAIKNRPATLWAWPLAAIACASPDIDLVFIHTPLEFLELHRGITHSFAFMPVMSLILALLFYPLWRKSTKKRWSFVGVWFFCCLMLLLHTWLDVVTTYGTMVLLPFSHYRVRWNSLFIVDLCLTLPLLWALWRWRAKRGLIVLALLWTFVYPAAGVGFNYWHTNQWREKLASENTPVAESRVLPDLFMPLFWRIIYEDKSGEFPAVKDASLDFFGRPRAIESSFVGLDRKLIELFKETSLEGEVFFDFAVLPVARDLPEKFMPEDASPDKKYYLIHDLRFGSGLKFVQKILEARPNADMPFLFMAELSGELENPRVDRIRLRFSDSGRDSGWHIPQRPEKPTIWQWLVGLR